MWGSNGPMPVNRPVGCLPGVFRYIQKIEDVLTYDKKQNLSHGVLVRRFPSQEGMVVYRNKVNQLMKWQVQDISKLGLVFGREHLPIQVIPAPSRKRGRPRRDDGER